MTKAELDVLYLLVRPWIAGTLLWHAPFLKTTASFGFSRLPAYFRPKLLLKTNVAVVNRVPLPPLKLMGLAKFAASEQLNPDGLSYLDTYFVKRDCQTDESVHFHELVHIIQWRLLGAERLVIEYMKWLETQDYHTLDYRRSPLEVMADGLQARFDRNKRPFDVEAEVARQLETF